MKLADVLNNIEIIVSKDQPNKDQCDESKIFTSYVINKLKNIFEQKIHINQDQILDKNISEELLNFYKEIFLIIANTDLIPPHSPSSLLTKVTLAVAKQISNVCKINKYQILMPTITVTEYETSAISINDPDLKLTDFVLSDDNTAIIHVYSCLSQASIQGELKHGYLVDGKSKLLSESEKLRVINHSKNSLRFWKAIQKKIDVTTNGQSFGAILKRLAQDLAKGGVNGRDIGGNGGHDLDSGAEANIGIVNFFDWYNQLSDTDRKVIEELPQLYTNIKLLQRGSNNNITDNTVYCVELISDSIMLQLDQNPELYSKHQQNEPDKNISVNQEAVNINIAIEDTKLYEEMKLSNHEITATYGVNGQQLFITNFKSNNKYNKLSGHRKIKVSYNS